jgi:hypothetical protein
MMADHARGFNTENVLPSCEAPPLAEGKADRRRRPGRELTASKEPDVSTMRDYSDAQWKSIAGAPAAAALLITLADASGPIGVLKEGMAVTRALTDATGDDVPEVITSLVAEFRSGAIRPQLPTLPYTDRDQAKAVLLESVKAAVAAVESVAPAEVQAYKRWIVTTATRVAAASKEGGFLGIGGTLISAEEQAALTDLATALGVAIPASPTT